MYAHLRVADTTVLTHAAAPVVMDHYALTERRLGIGHTRSAFSHHTTRLVPGYEGKLPGLIGSHITYAHARSANGNDNFPRAGLRICKLAEFDTSVAQKNEALHSSERS